MKLVIVTGLSGSGKSTALQSLEDLGYYCVDNLPVSLLSAFAAQLAKGMQHGYENAAVGIDARTLADDLQQVPQLLEEISHSGLLCEMVFLDAGDKSLLKRFSETRRKHPLSRLGMPLGEAIAFERRLLAPMLTHASINLDTSDTNVHQLRELIRSRMGQRERSVMAVLFLSFAYKKGIPADADFVFDLRCLPNPHWQEDLRPLSGLDTPVATYLEAQPSIGKMRDELVTFLDHWAPAFEAENRSYMTVALGCTGGQHRSVYMAQCLADHFSKMRDNVQVRHRDIT